MVQYLMQVSLRVILLAMLTQVNVLEYLTNDKPVLPVYVSGKACKASRSGGDNGAFIESGSAQYSYQP